jgi:hypothetical protein
MASLNHLKETFKETLNKFIDNCIPLSLKENYIYFISESNQLYGFDMSKNILFEPSSVNKFNLISNSMDAYFTDDVKSVLEEKTKLKFADLTELTLKVNYREKYIGRKFFFLKNEGKIYIWSMVNGKWEKSDVDTLRHIFSNNDILIEPSSIKKSDKAKSLDDLGIDFHDLDEISLRFKDASIHYFHRKLNKVYSLNIALNLWYIPTDSVQKQLLSHVKRNCDQENKRELNTATESCNPSPER